MKTRGALPTIAWVLLGIIVLAAITLSFGAENDEFNPAPSSYGPSGTKAFTDLLREQGYQVSYSEDPNFRFSAHQVALGIYPMGSPSEVQGLAQQDIESFLGDGGSAIWLVMDQNFMEASRNAGVSTAGVAAGVKGSTLKVNVSGMMANPIDAVKDQFPVASWMSQPLATLGYGPGKVLTVGDGIIATNQFIDQNDNAEVLMNWIKLVAPPGSNLVVMGATYGAGSAPGMTETMGPWAHAGWLQLILLFAVIVYTLGKPFGYPDEARRRQLAARDFVDAVAQTYRRAKAAGVALNWIAKDADHEIRRRLNISYDVPVAERNRSIPEPLANVLTDAQAAASMRVPAKYALKIAKALDHQLTNLFGEKSARRKSKYRM